MISNHYYDNCISLGWYCGTASSLAKYGLRSFSGPFDWYFSDFQGVLRQIDGEFRDFLMKDNLEIAADNPRSFRDVKYGFRFFHDVHYDLDSEYPDIRDKYLRRIDRFMQAISNPTCFFRAVRSMEELEFISNHKDYIDSILKRKNPDNSVIYVYVNGMNPHGYQVKGYELSISEYGMDAAALRDMFDTSPELIHICHNVLEPDIVNKNKRYDDASNAACAAEIYRMMQEGDDRVCIGLMKGLNATPDSGIWLWGAGFQGKAMQSYLEKQGVRILGVIDSNRLSFDAHGFSCKSPEDIENCGKIFIAIADELDNKELISSLSGRAEKVMTYKQLFHLIK